MLSRFLISSGAGVKKKSAHRAAVSRWDFDGGFTGFSFKSRWCWFLSYPKLLLFCFLKGGGRMSKFIDHLLCGFAAKTTIRISPPCGTSGSPTSWGRSLLRVYVGIFRPVTRWIYRENDHPNFSSMRNFGSPTRRKRSLIRGYAPHPHLRTLKVKFFNLS